MNECAGGCSGVRPQVVKASPVTTSRATALPTGGDGKAYFTDGPRLREQAVARAAR